MNHTIFISYSRKDSTIADYLCNTLENDNIQCWIAPRNIAPGIEYSKAISDAIEKCKIFISIISDESINSNWIINEIEYALLQAKTIIPLFIGNPQLNSSLKYHLARIQQFHTSSPAKTNEIIHFCSLVKEQLSTKQETLVLNKELPIVSDTDCLLYLNNAIEPIVLLKGDKYKINPQEINNIVAVKIKIDKNVKEEIKISPAMHNLQINLQSREPYTVFISHKSEDYELYAKPIYNYLTKSGIKAFLSEIDIPNVGDSAYRKLIVQAITECRHMILVGSSLDYIKSSYVYSEWDMFLNLMWKGSKPGGNFITILANNIKLDNSLADLDNYHVTTFNKFEDIISFLT